MEQAREQAVRRLLVRRQAARLGVTVQERSVEARLDALRERIGGEKALAAALSGAKMTVEQLDAAIRYSLLESALQDEMYADVSASDADVKTFYRENRADLFTRPAQVRLRRITLPSRNVASLVARDVAEGADFATLARRHSIDRATRDAGGMLGWVALSSLPPEVKKALAPVSRGGVSEPVFALGRWHLYQVLDRRPETVLPLREVSAEIATEVTRRRRAAALEEWIGRARERATVESSP